MPTERERFEDRMRTTTMIGFLAAIALSLTAEAIESSFTYQGTLRDPNGPATGAFDLRFSLQDAMGAEVVSPLQFEGVSVDGGQFTVSLDFGNAAFTGATRYLEIGVRAGDSVGNFATLSPRTLIATTPYAQVSGQAQFATTVAPNAVTGANVADGSLGIDDLSGVQARIATACPAGQFITSVGANGDPTCVAPPPASLSTNQVAIPNINVSVGQADACETNSTGTSVTVDGPPSQLPAGTYLVTLPMIGTLDPVGGTINATPVFSLTQLRYELRSASLGQFAQSVYSNSSGASGNGETTTLDTSTRTFRLLAPTDVFIRANAFVLRCGSISGVAGRQALVLRIGE